MKELIKFTVDFDFFDVKKPYEELMYNILIIHDNAKMQFEQKIRFQFYNLENEIIPTLNVNSWGITKISTCYYYGSAKISIQIKDPKGIYLPEIETGGFSIGIDEKFNIDVVKGELKQILKKVKLYSCFLDFRSRLDYVNDVGRKHPQISDF